MQKHQTLKRLYSIYYYNLMRIHTRSHLKDIRNNYYHPYLDKSALDLHLIHALTAG